VTVGRAKPMNIYTVPFIDFVLVLLKSFIMTSCVTHVLRYGTVVFIALLADWSCTYLKPE